MPRGGGHGTRREIAPPPGYVFLGWRRSTGGIQTVVRESKLHLVRAADPKDKRTLCGARPGRGANFERPMQYTPDYSDRGICSRCTKAAASARAARRRRHH